MNSTEPPDAPNSPLSDQERIERLESAVGLLILHIRGKKPLTDEELDMIEEDLRKGAEPE